MSAAYLIAFTEVIELPPLSPEKIWHDMIFTPGCEDVPPAIEEMPSPLSFWAAITPATCVPWPVSEMSSQEMTPVSVTKL